jgi:hypothetical protein
MVQLASYEIPWIKRAVDDQKNNGDQNAGQDFILSETRIHAADMIGSKSR